ncbi:hypothetical protein DXB43_09965 [Roseburia sp. OM04-10BH]|uniref:hypothetical protein n=1 Tax=unclassified Roseburia TaxID=2637578 RepID=UPI000E4C16F3|nr:MULTISPECIES: hypothetical protein [unclassified Roseburia]RGI43164.1 hypothetical protein DXB43_09965 [Roseburia sp. OM04-10BH]RHV39644.1 hypothetical protein DXB49_10125 [Roseburia sp. OM04-15AA]RHV60063.1 hypothetical protein DXB42_03820 [Roseburia sp. OM04-10AA]
MEEAKQNIKQKKDSYNLRIVTAVLVLTVLVLGELYVMINYPSNYVALIVLTVVALADIYILIASAIQKNYKKEIDQYEQYDNLFKSEKASYLVTRKSFEDIADQLDRIEEAAGSPTKDIIDAQKSIAKVTISRNKENSDALMNSNDKLLEQIFNLSDRLDNLEKNMLEQQRIVVENANKDLLLKQQEMAAFVKEMELSIHNTILAEVGKINGAPAVAYTAAPVQPSSAAPVEEVTPEEPEAPIDEVMPEEPKAPINEVMSEEPATPINEVMSEEPATEPETVAEDMPDLAEDDLLNIDALFGNDEAAETTKEVAEENNEPEPEEPVGFDDTLGFADEEPEEPAFTEEMVNTIDEPVKEMNSDPNHMMTPEEIAALIANADSAAEEAPVVTEDAISEESEPITEEEPVSEPVVEEPAAEPVIEANSDPNHMMTPEEIAALFANM